jgi:hypothetical protein
MEAGSLRSGCQRGQIWVRTLFHFADCTLLHILFNATSFSYLLAAITCRISYLFSFESCHLQYKIFMRKIMQYLRENFITSLFCFTFEKERSLVDWYLIKIIIVLENKKKGESSSVREKNLQLFNHTACHWPPNLYQSTFYAYMEILQWKLSVQLICAYQMLNKNTYTICILENNVILKTVPLEKVKINKK